MIGLDRRPGSLQRGCKHARLNCHDGLGHARHFIGEFVNTAGNFFRGDAVVFEIVFFRVDEAWDDDRAKVEHEA